MEIAILTQHFLPAHVGGCERAAYNLAKRLAKRGHVAHVITREEHSSGERSNTIDDEFTVHYLDVPDIPLLRSITYGIKAFRLVTDLEPDLVHAQTISVFNSGFGTALIALGSDIPYTVWGQGTDVYGATKWHARLERPIQRYILEHAETAIALTEDMKQRMEAIAPENDVEIIPNGIDVERFTAAAGDELPGITSGSGTKTLLFVGRLHPVKGLSHLIEAMPSVLSAVPETELVIVGDGAARDELEAAAVDAGVDSHVHFTGRVPNETVAVYMDSADVFVLPSLSEGFPLVVLEAMASGLPIVASETRGLDEIIEPGRNGFLAQPAAPTDLADCLVELLDDESLRKTMSLRNRAKARQHSWSNVVEQVATIYRSAAAVEQPGPNRNESA